MKTSPIRPEKRPGSTNGVALVAILGLLAVLTLLAVAFAIAQRVERMSARNYMNMVKAKHLVRTCLGRAMDDIDATMEQKVYPDWPTGEAMASSGAIPCPDMLAGEITRAIPAELLPDAQTAAASAGWRPITVDGEDIGRICFVAINSSGLLDANRAGGALLQGMRTNLNELVLGSMSDIGDEAAFLTARELDVRYETVPELAASNPEVTDLRNLTTYSLDPQKDEFFYESAADGSPANWYDDLALSPRHPRIDPTTPPPRLGFRDAPLTNKFCLNDITNYPCYSVPVYQAYLNDNSFYTNYFLPLKNILEDCGFVNSGPIKERPIDIAWNIINYLDLDRIPHAGLDEDGKQIAYPYTHTEGGEPIPLINEIVFERTDASLNTYKVSIEIWYPFAPIPVVASDRFSLKAGIYTAMTETAPMSDQTTIAANTDVLSDTYTYLSKEWQIPNMKFGTSSEFQVFEMTFNIPMGGGTNGIPGEVGTNNMAISSADPVYFYCQVRKQDDVVGGSVVNAVDDSMGYSDGSESGQGITDKRALFPLGATDMRLPDWGFKREGRGYSVCDPRSNGQVKYWTSGGKDWRFSAADGNKNGMDYPPASHTLGSINANCHAYAEGRSQGLPIYAYNGPMRNIGELGNIFRSNLDDQYGDAYDTFWFWQTINLMHGAEGAMLADVLTVRDWETQQGPRHGQVCINSAQKEVLRALFYDMEIGPTNCGIPLVKLRPMDVELIVDAIDNSADKPWHTFQDMFTDDGQAAGSAGFADGGGYRTGFNEVALAIRTAVQNSVNSQLGRPLSDPVADVYKEDPFRKICELITFRQNMFTIALAAQALGPEPPDGTPAQPIAEKRAMATVYRDSYTGRYFIRSFKWIAD